MIFNRETAMKKNCLSIICFFMVVFSMASIKNPDKPLKGEWDFKPEPVWTVNQAGANVLGRPLQVLVTENGRIIVYDSKFRINRLFGPDGHFVTSFGKNGEGPGEIKNQAWMYSVTGKVVIPDGGRIHYFNPDGSYDKSLKKPFSQNPVLFLNEDEFISAPLTVFGATDGKAKISLFDVKSQNGKLISEFEVFKGGVGRSGDQVYDIIMPGLSPMMIVGYHEGRLYYGMNNSYAIHISALDGKNMGVFSVSREKRKVSLSLKRERFKNSRMPENAVKQIIESLPDEIACFDRIEVHHDMIYVYVADLEHWKKGNRNPKQIDIFSPEGQYLYRCFLRFDEGSHLFFTPFSNLVIRDGYLVAALEDTDGEVKLVKYNVSLPL